MSLADKIRAARETWVTIEGYDFLVRRPTIVQMVRWRDGAAADDDALRICVVGWRGVKESDLIPGGEASTPPFDVDALIEWAQDRPLIWKGLLEGINASIERHAKAQETTQKNDGGPGSSGDRDTLRQPGPQAKHRSDGRGSVQRVAADGERIAVGSG